MLRIEDFERYVKGLPVDAGVDVDWADVNLDAVAVVGMDLDADFVNHVMYSIDGFIASDLCVPETTSDRGADREGNNQNDGGDETSASGLAHPVSEERSRSSDADRNNRIDENCHQNHGGDK